jgi:hypothetical protein
MCERIILLMFVKVQEEPEVPNDATNCTTTVPTTAERTN